MALGHRMWLLFVLFFPVQAVYYCFPLPEGGGEGEEYRQSQAGSSVCIKEGPKNWAVSQCKVTERSYAAGSFDDGVVTSCAAASKKDFAHYALDQAGIEYHAELRNTFSDAEKMAKYLATLFPSAVAVGDGKIGNKPQKFVAVSGLLGWSGGVGRDMPIFTNGLIPGLTFGNPVWLRTPDPLFSYFSEFDTRNKSTLGMDCPWIAADYPRLRAQHLNTHQPFARFVTGILTGSAVASGWDIVLDSADFLATTANLKQLADALVETSSPVAKKASFEAYYFELRLEDAALISNCNTNIKTLLEAERKAKLFLTGGWATGQACAYDNPALAGEQPVPQQKYTGSRATKKEMVQQTAKWAGQEDKIAFRDGSILLNEGGDFAVTAEVFWVKVTGKPTGKEDWQLNSVEKIVPAPRPSAAFVEVQPPVAMPASTRQLKSGYQNSALQVEEVARP